MVVCEVVASVTEFLLDPPHPTILQILSIINIHSFSPTSHSQSSSSSSSFFQPLSVSVSHPVISCRTWSSMPGTIHVSVLDFSDLPSTSSSSVLFKVSMGKREYQTLDKGDFTFQVKSLREKLILVVLDDVGREMRQTVVEAILIVQKGQWDDYFTLDGGGRVRMRLQFVLSDEDRVKIRKMRESALLKKCSQLFITHPEFQRSISLDVGLRTRDISVDFLSHRKGGTEAGNTSPVVDAVRYTKLSIHDENKEEDAENKEKINPDKSDRDTTGDAMPLSTASDLDTFHSAEVNTRALVENQDDDKQYVDTSPGALNFKQSTFTSKGKLFVPTVDDQASTINEGKMRKTPSSVRKMISAFEYNTTQDAKPRNKPPPLKSSINKLGFENLSNDLIADEVIIAAATEKLSEMSSEIVVSPSFFSELRQKVFAKKRQISYDVVEIITIAPERGLTKASADELVTEHPETESETCVSAVDGFDLVPVDVRTDSIAALEDVTGDPKVETRDNADMVHMELDNKDMQFFDEKIEFAMVEKDSVIIPQDDSNTKFYDPPQDQMTTLNVKTEKGISAEDTHMVTKNDRGPESDVMSSAKQQRFNDTSSDNQNSENSISAEDTVLVTEDGGCPKNDRAATVYEDSVDNTPSAKQLVLDDMHCGNLNSGRGIIKVSIEKKPPSGYPHHVNKGTMSFKKLDNTKPLIEWTPASEPPSSWVFPDETREPCFAPSNIQFTNSIAGSKTEASINVLEHNMGSARKAWEERKHGDGSSSCPGGNDSAGDGNPKGQFAQAINIAIMVAFGALVFFSRQRNHR